MGAEVPDTGSPEAVVQEAVALGTLQFHESTNCLFFFFAKTSWCRVSAALKRTDCCSLQQSAWHPDLEIEQREGEGRLMNGHRDGEVARAVLQQIQLNSDCGIQVAVCRQHLPLLGCLKST